MSRWLFAALCALCAAAFGFVEPGRSPTARALGGACAHDRECQLGLQCTFLPDVLEGQCSASCNSTPACQERFGEQSLCLGADVCARACTSLDAQTCPKGSTCNLYGWCESAP
jgi:hypothetical protein